MASPVSVKKKIGGWDPTSMRKAKLQFVKTVTAKGRRYEYFDTGVLRANGQPILKRMPARDDVSFFDTYASLMAGRSRRRNVAVLISVPQLIDLYERSPEYRRLAPSTRKTYGYYLDAIRNQMNTAPAGAVERRDFLMLRDKMADRMGAANAMIRTGRALYKWARAREHVAIDPCKGIELFDSKDYEPWPETVLSAGLLSDDPGIRLPIALLYFTAQRIGDICALRWSDIREGHVFVRQQKTGKELEIRLHADLAAELERTPRSSITVISGGTIISDAKGKPLKTEALRDRLQAFAAARGAKVVPHGLRKNAVNALLEAGCTVAETAAVSGQSLKMVEHYAKQRSTRKLASAAILKLERSKK
jgi:integrase